MNDITELHLEPRVARLETGLETLTRNVSELTVTMRENSTITNQKIDSLMISVTNAQAPKKTDWSVFISLGFFIMAMGSAVFWPLNQTAENNKEDTKRISEKFDLHSQLNLHPVGQALLQRIEDQLQTHIIVSEKILNEHSISDDNKVLDLEKKLKSEVADLDTRLQLEMRFINSSTDTKVDLINKYIFQQLDLDIKELREWRNKTSGLNSPSSKNKINVLPTK